MIGTLLRVSRPVSWVNTAYPFAAAAVLTGGLPLWVTVVGTIFFLVPYNLAMYGINDVFDYESDLRNPRKGGVEGAVVDRAEHRRVLLASCLLPVPFVAVLTGWALVQGDVASVLVLAVSLFAVVAYSWAGLRFKERPFLDAATSATHFVSPAVYGLVLAGARPTAALTALVVGFFLWGMASQIFGAVQDVLPDREGGLASVATVLGARRAVAVSVALYASSGLLMLATEGPGRWAAVLAVPYIVNAGRHLNVTDASSGRAHGGWRVFLWLNYVTGFLVTLLLIAWAWQRGGGG
ncbi:prenyltransferase [Micrococcus luteus]